MLYSPGSEPSVPRRHPARFIFPSIRTVKQKEFSIDHINMNKNSLGRTIEMLTGVSNHFYLLSLTGFFESQQEKICQGYDPK